MSQLIQLKQRIKAIETIRKITNAMRVISMSMHSKLGNKLSFLESYKKELSQVLSIVKNSIKEDQTKSINSDKKLLIILGSDKGLCGTFNSGIIKLTKNETLSDYEILTVGKKITDFIKKKSEIKYTFKNLNYKTIQKITIEIFQIIENGNFKAVYCLNTKPKSFFLQVPEKNILWPINEVKDENIDTSDYMWEEKPEELYYSLKKEYLKFTISYSLFESLFAEQAARFQSMDSATRNAEKILDQMKIQYSKLRQAKITQEINELTSHF